MKILEYTRLLCVIKGYIMGTFMGILWVYPYTVLLFLQ